MKRFFLRIHQYGSLLFALMLSGCGTSGKEVLEINISGSSTIAPLLNTLAQSYEQMHPNTQVNVQAGGSSRGIRDIRAGLADIAMVSRALKASETDLVPHLIAKDGIAMIVHRNNPIKTLNSDNVRDIYTGAAANWSTFNKDNSDIVVVNKAEGHSTLELFLAYFQLKNSNIQADTIIGDNQQGIKTISGNQHAIGYVSIGSAEYSIQRNVPIKMIATDGVPANSENVQNNRFPLVRPLNLVTTNRPKGLSADFIAFATSQDTHSWIKQHFFIPITNTNEK